MTKHIKLKFSIVILLALVLLGGTITLASLSRSTQAATNPFKTGEITTNIEEGDVNIDGATINKKPSVYNDGPNPAIIRMRITISPNKIADMVGDSQSPIFIDYRTSSKDTDKGYWEYSESDGFWYYSQIVPSKKSTEPLFTTIKGVTNDSGIANAGMEDFQITLYQEAVQPEVWIDGKSTKTESGLYKQSKAIWEAYTKKQK